MRDYLRVHFIIRWSESKGLGCGVDYDLPHGDRFWVLYGNLGLRYK